MSDYSKIFKRSQSLILAIAILLTAIGPVWWSGVSADVDPDPLSKNAGQVIADNYELTEAEKEIISTGYFIGDVYEYTKPTDGDGLLDVDFDGKKITAKSFKDEQGNVWKPVSAYLLDTTNSKVEDVSFSESNGVHTGTYEYDQNAFSVKVNYEATVTIDEATQNAILNAPAELKQLIANMGEIEESIGDLDLITLVMDSFIELANGKEITVYGMPVKVYLDVADNPLHDDYNPPSAAYAAVMALKAQMDANGDIFDLMKYVQEYNSISENESSIKWLMDNGDSILACLEKTRDYISDIVNAGFFADKVTLDQIKDYDKTLYSNLLMVKNTMNDWVSVSDEIIGNDWSGLDVTIQTGADYNALDLYIASVGEITKIDTIKNPLILDTTVLTYNMAMSDVTVIVKLKITEDLVGSKKLIDADINSTVITLANNSTAEEIKNAVNASGIIDNSLVEWKDYGYIQEYFEDFASELPDALTKDIEYVITYSPKYYTLKYTEGYDAETEESVPYGYKAELTPHKDSSKAYDYTVNGEYYAQGSKITITQETTISRKEGKSYVSSNLKDIVNKHYFDSKSDSFAILDSEAVVIGNKEISVRYPDNSNGIVSIKNNVLTAKAYDASYSGLNWMPYQYTIISGEDKATYLFEKDATTATINGDYDSIEVVYRLMLTGITNEEILKILNVPYILVQEAAAQKDALDAIAKYTGQMEQLNKAKLSSMITFIENSPLHSDPVKSEELQTYFMSVIRSMIDNCVDTNGSLRIYNILSTYSDPHNGGLKYYYLNSGYIINEINVLSGYLSDLLADEEKKDALALLLEANNMGEFIEKIEKLEGAMNDVKNALKAPNEVINLSSDSLSSFVEVLTKAIDSNDVNEYDALPKVLYLESDSFALVADAKVRVVVSVQVAGKNPIYTDAILFTKDHIITSDDVAKITAAVEQKIAELGINGKYYETLYKNDIFDSYEGKEASEIAVDHSFVWTPIKYTVNVEGAGSQIIDINNLEIALPSGTALERYDYSIDGKVVSSGSYRFTLDQIDRLFVDEQYTVDRIVVDVQRENLINMVNKLNDSISGDAIKFVLKENNGKYSIVMKVNANDVGSIMSAVQGVAMGLLDSGYSYIGMDGNGLMYSDDNTNSLVISMQAVVDAIMNSGFGSDTIIKVMDENGVVKNLVLEGDIISNAVLNALGGELIKTTMQLGNSASDSYDVDFYITLGNSSGAIVKLRNLLAKQLAPYFSFVCEDGQVKLNLTLPEKAYEGYLAVLLATDNVDITDINSLNGEIAIGFVKDIIDPLFTGNVTTQTIENTLNMLGYKLELSGYETVFQAICDAYKNFTFTYDDNSTTAEGNIAIADIIDKLNVGDLGKMIAEYSTGLDLKVNVALDNLGNTYNGLYFDINAEGITNKIGLSKDIASKIPNLSGTSLVVLLDDIDANSRLVFDKTTVLNLNGQRVAGDIVSNGNLIIIDTTITTGECGVVEGMLSGNITVVSGKYYSDVTDYIKTGYTQNDDGVVVNDIYTIVKDQDGNVTVEIDAGLLATETLPNIKAIAVDLVAELVFNGYTVNKLYIDGNKVYNISLEDFVGLYAGDNTGRTLIEKITEMVDSTELAKIVNAVLADITDFAAIEEAINNNAPILKYTLTTGAWNVKLEHVEDGDYLTGTLDSSSEKESTLSVLITGSDADKKLVADIFGELADTTDVDVSVDMDQGFDSNNDKNFILDWSAQGSVIVDLTGNQNYAIMLSVMIADGLSASERADLVAGIKAYYTTYTFTELEKAFNNLTVSQVIKALKNLSKDDSFEAMITGLGLDGYVDAEVVELEKKFDAVAKIVAAVVRKINITGGDRLLGSFIKADGTYSVSKENISKELLVELLKGYTLTLDLDITNVHISIDIFGETAPEFVDGTGTPEIGTSDKLHGVHIDTANKIIYLDAHFNGIKADELKEIIKFFTKYADGVEVVIGDGTNKNISNGTKLVATAYNSSDIKTSVEYTIVVLGDVNGNGRLESGDAVLVLQSSVQMITLTDVQKLAADMDLNGRLLAGDAHLIAKKIIYWDEYVSALDNLD